MQDSARAKLARLQSVLQHGAVRGTHRTRSRVGCARSPEGRRERSQDQTPATTTDTVQLIPFPVNRDKNITARTQDRKKSAVPFISVPASSRDVHSNADEGLPTGTTGEEPRRAT